MAMPDEHVEAGSQRWSMSAQDRQPVSVKSSLRRLSLDNSASAKAAVLSRLSGLGLRDGWLLALNAIELIAHCATSTRAGGLFCL